MIKNFFLAFITAILAFCVTAPQLTKGTTDETQTGTTIAGVIFKGDGSNAPAADAEVRLYDSNAAMRPISGLAKGAAGIRGRTSRTDVQGRFSFDSVDTGGYFIYVNDHDTLGLLLTKRIAKADTVWIEDTAKAVGSIQGKLDTSLVSRNQTTCVYIAELQLKVAVDSTGAFNATSLPPFNYTLRVLHDSTVVSSKLDTGKVAVQEGETVIVNTTTPDSPRMIFSRGDTVGGSRYSTRSDLYLMNSDGTDAHLLYRSGGNAGQARYSPDKSKVVFYSDSSTTGMFEIFIIKADGSGIRQVTRDSTVNNEMNPCFFNDSLLWYVNTPTYNYNGVLEIYETNVNGDNKRQVSNFVATGFNTQSKFDFNVSRTRVFYYKQNSAMSSSGEIYSANIDFSNEQRLTSNSTWDGQPRLSPDGTRVVFVRSDNGDGYSYPYNIYIMNSDGTGAAKLTDATGVQFCIDPVWSPDGGTIAYSYNDGAQTDIYTMNVDCSGKRNLTNTSMYNERIWDWR